MKLFSFQMKIIDTFPPYISVCKVTIIYWVHIIQGSQYLAKVVYKRVKFIFPWLKETNTSLVRCGLAYQRKPKY